MRSLGLIAAAAIVSLAACAKDPDYGTGTAGTSGGGTGGRRRNRRQRGQLHAAGAEVVAPEPDHLTRRTSLLISCGRRRREQRDVPQRRLGRGIAQSTSPSWVAIKLAAGPTRILASWDDGGTYNYEDPAGTTVYGFPADYHFEVSSDSTNGVDGTWTVAGDMVTGNQFARGRTRSTSPARPG